MKNTDCGVYQIRNTVDGKRYIGSAVNLGCGYKEPEIKLTLDHVIPLSKGGRNIIDNIQPLCLACNDSKGTKNTDYR